MLAPLLVLALGRVDKDQGRGAGFWALFSSGQLAMFFRGLFCGWGLEGEEGKGVGGVRGEETGRMRVWANDRRNRCNNVLWIAKEKDGGEANGDAEMEG